MWYKKILFVGMSLCFNLSQSQMVSNKFRVNFKVDEYIIDDDDKRTLDELVGEVTLEKYCEMTLSAHTDNDADDNYNINLSMRRAKSVYDYLVSKGVNEKVMDIGWYGERKPEVANITEEAKAANRRVDIEVRKYKFTTTDELLKETGGNYTQIFKLKGASESIVTGMEGTKITIPQDAFETKDGKAISNDKVEIKLEEYQKPMDAIFNNLSTMCDGKILESGGMFRVTANYNGEPLKVRKGKTLPVEMPSKNMKKDMQLFYGNANENKIITWKNANIPFSQKKLTKVQLPSVKLKEDYLRTLVQEVNIVKGIKFQMSNQVPNISQVPRIPRKPKKYTEVTASDILTNFQQKLYPKILEEKIIAKENKRRKDIYEKRMERYERKMRAYFMALEKYRNDSTSYEAAMESTRNWISAEINKNEIFIEEIDRRLFNQSLQGLLAANKNNKLNMSNPERYLFNQKINLGVQGKIQYYKSRVSILNWMMMLTNEELCKLSLRNEINYDWERVRVAYEKFRMGIRFNKVDEYHTNRFSKKLLLTDSLLKKVFADYYLVYNANAKKSGIKDEPEAKNIYNTFLSDIGYINCDRFASVPPTSMFTIQLKASKTARTYCYIKEMNSMIYPVIDSNDVSNFRLPKGTKVELIVVDWMDKMPIFEMIQHNVVKQEMIESNAKPVSLKEIQYLLALL